MVFSSIEFLFLFLPVFLIVYVVFSRNIVLLAFSLFFYFFGEGWFTAILLLSITQKRRYGAVAAGLMRPATVAQQRIIPLFTRS